MYTWRDNLICFSCVKRLLIIGNKRVLLLHHRSITAYMQHAYSLAIMGYILRDMITQAGFWTLSLVLIKKERAEANLKKLYIYICVCV